MDSIWNNIWSLFWLTFWGVAFVTYLIALVSVLIDIFRDGSLNGWLKAVWIVFLVFVPFLTVLIYLIARGSGMAERQGRDRGVVSEPDYTPRASDAPAADIAQAKALLDKGVISAGEFDALKAKALGNRY